MFLSKSKKKNIAQYSQSTLKKIEKTLQGEGACTKESVFSEQLVHALTQEFSIESFFQFHLKASLHIMIEL